ncbi:hypothetical protein FA13DRAFT_1786343 [Coprinellus micaceus]|uniref:Uncharacterized protein n=1 Tax=Coprinellus micaceus TaxID=71717 RepID=A0A4Y7TTA1_COPMI|nr:hypothetical protein FA13DRAFT_1786343 [Coprinellus micaceus]
MFRPSRKSKLNELEHQYRMPTAGRPGKSKAELEESVTQMVKKDTKMQRGLESIKDFLRGAFMVPRRLSLVRTVMHRIAPEGFDIRYTGGNLPKTVRVALTAFGSYVKSPPMGTKI